MYKFNKSWFVIIAIGAALLGVAEVDISYPGAGLMVGAALAPSAIVFCYVLATRVTQEEVERISAGVSASSDRYWTQLLAAHYLALSSLGIRMRYTWPNDPSFPNLPGDYNFDIHTREQSLNVNIPINDASVAARNWWPGRWNRKSDLDAVELLGVISEVEALHAKFPSAGFSNRPG